MVWVLRFSDNKHVLGIPCKQAIMLVPRKRMRQMLYQPSRGQLSSMPSEVWLRLWQGMQGRCCWTEALEHPAKPQEIKASPTEWHLTSSASPSRVLAIVHWLQGEVASGKGDRSLLSKDGRVTENFHCIVLFLCGCVSLLFKNSHTVQLSFLYKNELLFTVKCWYTHRGQDTRQTPRNIRLLLWSPCLTYESWTFLGKRRLERPSNNPQEAQRE